MIKTFHTFGSVAAELDEYAGYFTAWSNPFAGRKSEESIVLIAEIEERQLKGSLQPEIFNPKRVDRYLFRGLAGARATSLVPTLNLYNDPNEPGDNLLKFEDKLKRCLLANVALYEQYFDVKGFLERINPAINEAVKSISFKGNLLFTLRIDGKYLGEIEDIRQILIDEAYGKYKRSKKAEFVGQDKVCAVTYETVPEVWGRVDTLGFTIDDEAFMRGGFDADDAYKMFPVSANVVPILEGSRRLILEKLSYSFYGMKYFVVPHFLTADQEVKEEVIRKFLNVSTKPKNLEEQTAGIIANETIINEICEDGDLRPGGVYYDIFFYQPNNAQFLIKLHLSDILPSRFQTIQSVKEGVETRYKLLNQITIPAKGKVPSKIIPYELRVSSFKDYFSDIIQKKSLFHPLFFRVLESIFYGTSLSEEQILQTFLDRVITAYKNTPSLPYGFPQTVKRTFAVYYYFLHLGLFPSRKPMTDLPKTSDVGLTREAFVAQHPEFFGDENKAEKAAFYAGCLVEKLLEKQRIKLGSEPFRKYLNNLNLDQAKLQKVLIKLQDKLSQYGKEISDYEKRDNDTLFALVQPNLLTPTSVSKVRISYAFATGLVMQKEFAKEGRRLAKLAKAAKESQSETV